MLKVGTVEYSNTYNAFLDIFIDDDTFTPQKNNIVNEMAKTAYECGKKVPCGILGNGFIEEISFYDTMVYCFLVKGNYRLLFNYVPQSNLGIVLEDYTIDEIQHKMLHYINNSAIVNYINLKTGTEKINLCVIINTYEAFLNYTSINQLPLVCSSKTPFFNDFINNLVITNVDFSNNNEYGTITYNTENFTEFSYIYLDNTFIITNYSKLSRSNY